MVLVGCYVVEIIYVLGPVSCVVVGLMLVVFLVACDGKVKGLIVITCLV